MRCGGQQGFLSASPTLTPSLLTLCFISLGQPAYLFLSLARSRSVMTGEQMAAFHPPTTPNPLERPIKVGWLKKQRSIVKNWQQRYFVLRAQQLYYYKDEEDSKPQVPAGCVSLPQAQSTGACFRQGPTAAFTPTGPGIRNVHLGQCCGLVAIFSMFPGCEDGRNVLTSTVWFLGHLKSSLIL